jgi:hypothetical protein
MTGRGYNSEIPLAERIGQKLRRFFPCSSNHQSPLTVGYPDMPSDGFLAAGFVWFDTDPRVAFEHFTRLIAWLVVICRAGCSTGRS